jgi:prepilin peptidase CpaA
MDTLGFQVAIQVLLFGVLIVAATTDVLYKKVFNWLTYPAIAFGLTLGYCTGDLKGHFLGFLLGAGVFGVAALAGGVGGADWKLVGAIGAIKGVGFTVMAIFYSSLFGAVLAIGYLAYHGQILSGLKRTARKALFLSVETLPEGDPILQRIPYGVAIAFGTFFAWSLVEGLVPA